MQLSTHEFAKLVERALADMPKSFLPHLDNLGIDVEPEPTPAECESLGLDDPTELLGLYHGRPLTERGLEGSGVPADRVVLYQRNIERFCRTRREIVEQIRITLLHEIGHHFGLDEDELDELGYA